MTHSMTRRAAWTAGMVAALFACSAERETSPDGAASAVASNEAPSAEEAVTAPGPNPCTRHGALSSCVYKVADGLELIADVRRAPGDGVRPALLWIHGGALIVGHRHDIDERQAQRYLDAGYVVVSIDYRLAPETKLENIHQDVADAYGWLRERGASLFKIDPEKIGVVGHSAGGYLTLSSGFRLTPRPKALVSFYGYGDVTGAWYTTPSSAYLQDGPVSRAEAFRAIGARPIANSPVPGFDDEQRFMFYVYCRQQGLWPAEVSGHAPATEPSYFLPFEAVHNVGADYPPTILLHGRRDSDVPFAQSTAMVAALEAKGVAHELVENAEWEHGFDDDLDDPRVRSAFDRVIAFLDHHVK